MLVHDDRKQFEFLMMEVIQCGLNIQKREILQAQNALDIAPHTADATGL